MDRLTEKKANRFRFLNALYEATDGATNAIVEMWDLGESIELDREATSGVVDYLSGEHLLEHRALGGGIGITHYGVVEVEHALSEPEKPTQYFPPVVNITHVHSMVNSQIQQGTHGSQQTLAVSQSDLTAIRIFLDEFSSSIDHLKLTPEAAAEARAEVASVGAQLSSPKSKVSIVGEGLRSIRSILEGAAASSLASTLLPKLLPLLASLPH